MKTRIKVLTIAILLMSLVPNQLFSQCEFKKGIESMFKELELSYSFSEDNNSCKINYCENAECAQIFIMSDSFTEKTTTCFLNIGSYLLILRDSPKPTNSLINKVNELNSLCPFGKVAIESSEGVTVVYYTNFLWLADVKEDNLFNNIYLSYSYALKYKKELEVFKD